MKVDGTTTPFAVLGHPIAHSLSPLMHNASLKSLKMNAIYTAYDVAPEFLMEVLPAMARMGFRGVNLTIPLKEIAYAGIDRCDRSAEIAAAVNTVVFDDQGMRGYSTDGIGFLTDLKESLNICPRDRKVMILGCGGVGRTLAITCAEQGAQQITLANRTRTRANNVAHDVHVFAPDTPVAVATEEEWVDAAREADLIVQCTSWGMEPEQTALLPRSAFHSGQALYDTIYVSPTTPQMAAAREAGAATANGLGMLLHQGAASFRIWTGHDADTVAMRNALEHAIYQ